MQPSFSLAELKGCVSAEVWHAQKQDCGRIGWKHARTEKKLTAPVLPPRLLNLNANYWPMPIRRMTPHRLNRLWPLQQSGPATGDNAPDSGAGTEKLAGAPYE